MAVLLYGASVRGAAAVSHCEGIGEQFVLVNTAASDILTEFEKLQTVVPESAHQKQMKDVEKKADGFRTDRGCSKAAATLVSDAESVLTARNALAGFEQAIKGVTPAMVQMPPADPALVSAVHSVLDPLGWCSKKLDADALAERFRLLLQKGATHVVDGHFVDDHNNAFPDMEAVAPTLPPVTGNLQKLEESLSADPDNAVNLINRFVDGSGARGGGADPPAPNGAGAVAGSAGGSGTFDYKAANQSLGKQAGLKMNDVPAADLGNAPETTSDEIYRMKLSALAAMKGLPFVSQVAQAMLAKDLVPKGSPVKGGVDQNGNPLFTFTADPKKPIDPKQADDVARVFVAAQERFQGVHQSEVSVQKEQSVAAFLRDQLSDAGPASGPTAFKTVSVAMTADGHMEVVRTRANGSFSAMMAVFEPTLSGLGDGTPGSAGKGPGLGLTVYGGAADETGKIQFQQAYQYVGGDTRESVMSHSEVTQGFWSAATTTNKSYVQRSHRQPDGTWTSPPEERTALADNISYSGPSYLTLTSQAVGTVGKGIFDVGGGFIALGLSAYAPTDRIRDSLLAQARQDILNNAVNKEIIGGLMHRPLLAEDDPSVSVRTGLGAQIRKQFGEDGAAGVAANASDAVFDKLAPSLVLGVPGAKAVFGQLARVSPALAKSLLTGTFLYAGHVAGADAGAFILAQKKFEEDPSRENREARDEAETALMADGAGFIPMTNYAKAIRENSALPEAASPETPSATPPPLPSKVQPPPLPAAVPAVAKTKTDAVPAGETAAQPQPAASGAAPVARFKTWFHSFVHDVKEDEDGFQKVVSGLGYDPDPNTGASPTPEPLPPTLNK